MGKAPKIAVIQYPGTNCEFETARAAERAGMEAEIFRWNRPAEELDAFDGYILPGGFSYQDRVRAGAVAAKKPIVRELLRQSERGKLILGICNGAQVLVEAGLVPGIERPGVVEMALARNLTKGRSGYYCNWITVKVNRKKLDSPFLLDFEDGEIFALPVAHGEGRFLTQDKEVLEAIEGHGLGILQYCTPEGELSPEFPYNPNGAQLNLAGLSNPQGTVLALMPHPERAALLRQIPDSLPLPIAQARLEGVGKVARLREFAPAHRIFTSMRRALNQ